MSSTCFEPGNSSLGRRLYIQLYTTRVEHTLLPTRLLTLMHVKTYRFITSALDRDEGLTSSPGRFTSGSELHYPLNRRLCGPQRWSGRFG